MADQVPPSLITFLGAVVDAFRTQQAQIAELQGRVATLEGHAETVSGETGITTQLGDLSTVPDLIGQLAAAMPALAEPATTEGATQASTVEPVAEPQAHAA